MKLSHLSLAKRLYLGFGLVLAVACSVCLVGVRSLTFISDRATESSTVWLPRVKALADLDAALASLAVTRLRLLMVGPEFPIDAASGMVLETAEELRKQLALNAPLMASNEEQALFARIDGLLQTYLSSVPTHLAAARQGDVALVGATARKSAGAYLAARKLLAEVAALTEKGSQATRTTAAAEATRGRSLLVGGLAAMLVLGGLISWVISRELSSGARRAVDTTKRMAAGDLSQPIVADGQDEMAQLQRALEAMRRGLLESVAGVRRSAEGVVTASTEIAHGNSDLSSRTEQQASALQQTNGSMLLLARAVRQNADDAQQGNQLAQSASEMAARGGDVVGQVVQTMRGINDSSKKIAEITSVIDGIAFQTNILALNAAVEAARAGEQGRGFAVVASEVRSLAQRSAAAAKEIKSLISASVERVEEGSSLVDRARVTMGDVVGAIGRVTQIMAAISSASAEQSSGVQQVGQAVAQVDQATQQNAALVEQSAAASESLKQQARTMLQSVARFQL